MKENEKKLDLGEFFYVFKKHIIIEAVILLVCIIAGFVAAYLTPRYYVANTTLIVDMRFDETSNSITPAQLSKYYIPTIIELTSNDRIINDATNNFLDVDNEKCSAKSVTAKADEDVLTIDISYTDKSAELAKKKLIAIIGSLKSYVEKTKTVMVDVTDKDGNVIGKKEVEVPVNMQNLTKINPIYSTITSEVDENGDPVYSPNITVGSKKRTVVVLAAVIGVAAMFVYTLCVYFIADKVASVDRLESVSGIKNIATVEKKKSDKKEQKSPDALVELKLTKVADALIYDNICTGNKIYQVQSCLSGEGKTTVVANLAIALGKAQRKTLIVDCDFSHPTVHRKFLLHRHLGITEYFKGEKTFDEIVKTTAYTNVDVITCGERIENHTIFFTSDKFKSLLAEAKEKYDFILFDCAPVKVVSDYINISQLADAALLVVANEKVSAKDVAYAVEELDSSKANLIGTVFNFTDPVKNRSYYNYYYNNKAAEEAKETTEE